MRNQLKSVGLAALAVATLMGMTGPRPVVDRQPVLRCGWLDNPTPSNHWLRDADGEWTLSVQGQFSAPGFDRLPDMTTQGWVAQNGYYGYGCACIRMRANHQTRRAVEIISGRPIPLSRCQRDRALPRR